jgi:preprotein translocase subunit SecA
LTPEEDDIMPNQDIPIVGPILHKIFGSRNERFVKRYTQRVDAINALEPQMRPLTDEQLREMTVDFRRRVDEGTKADDILVEVFAVAREAMDRYVGIRNVLNPEHEFDASQLSGEARVMFDKAKAEMEAMEPTAPEGRFLGCNDPVPGWFLVDFPPELYEAIRELYPESRPPFRARPFDVQLIGGMVLGQGKIAEMKTGEGKTIVAPLAAYLAACQHQQVHVVTVNDYLVQRDRDWTFPFFAAVGLTVGAIHPQHTQPEDIKRQMYRCDVVYGTTSEFGFDYLRDNMKRSVDEQVQRKRQFAIVDEVDSILIDEARTPLIISGPAHDDKPQYDLADKLARHLVAAQKPWQDAEDSVRACKERIKGLEGDIRQTRDKSEVPELHKRLEQARAELPELERDRDAHTQFYELEMDKRSSHLTHEGIAEAQRVANIGSFYVDQNMDVPHLLEQSLRAHAVFQRDRDYIVMDVPDRFSGKTEQSIVIVDTNTGRPMIGRQWSDGLHQAVEAKENVPIKQETQTVASVTIQNFFKMYKRLAGMTGTADTEAQEFHDIYHLDVVSIPTNKPVIRDDYDDLLFLREKDKWEAIVDEIKHFHDAGRPILVGTTSVERSEMLGQMLARKHGVKHEILNAKQHEREANVVEGAGDLGAVMIATNMAGRGTDIKLGDCSREALVDHWLRRGIASRSIKPDMSEEELRENIFRKIAATELKDEGVRKRDAEEMDFEELELRLLRKWAAQYTWASPNKIATMPRDELMEALDTGARFSLHRIRWFDGVKDLGGLHVIGTERHESRRIDNQLRGRSGRQGDKGSSRFFVSLEDDLMKMFAGETTMKVLSRLGMKEGDAIEHPWLSKNVERAQRKVEERNFQIRKNILEYDEIAELQRQNFYGLRQRVLEGRDVKGLIFEYIEEAVDDAIEEFLDTEYPSQCAAEFARQKMDFSVMADKLRGKTVDEMEAVIRQQAKNDAASMIDVTLGEYMPVEGSEISVDFDSAGLVGWAKSQFGVELDAGEIREGGLSKRREVRDALEQAAFEKIDEADLSGLNQFVQKNYGAACLADWVKTKFDFEVPVEEIVEAQKADDRQARDPILEKTRELYRRREIAYPIDFMMELTMMLARQSPEDAFKELALWGRRRFGIELTEADIKTTPPAKMRERLLAESEKFVDEGRLEEEIEAALACETDEDLDTHLTERFGVGLTERMRYLDPEERDDAVRARVENLLRTEQLHFERTILLDTLDQAWREHLYAMDQLRDGISFRAFSQQDPRIAFKREGSRLFTEMMQGVRDRVTDYIFKARISPAAAMQARQGGPGGQQPPRPPQPQQRRKPAPSLGGGTFGGGMTGPGFDAPAPARGKKR